MGEKRSRETYVNDLIRDWIRPVATLKYKFLNRLREVKWLDTLNKQFVTLNPYTYKFDELSFSVPQLGHFKLSGFEKRRSTGEAMAHLEIHICQITANELIDLLKQLSKHRVNRRLLESDGSRPNWDRSRK